MKALYWHTERSKAMFKETVEEIKDDTKRAKHELKKRTCRVQEKS